MSRLLADEAAGEERLLGRSGKQSSGPWWSGNVSYLTGMLGDGNKQCEGLSRAVQVVLGRCHQARRLGGLNTRRLWSHSSGGQMSQIKVSTGFVSSEAPLLGLQAALVLLYLHITFPVCVSVSKTPLSIRTPLRC